MCNCLNSNKVWVYITIFPLLASFICLGKSSQIMANQNEPEDDDDHPEDDFDPITDFLHFLFGGPEKTTPAKTNQRGSSETLASGSSSSLLSNSSRNASRSDTSTASASSTRRASSSRTNRRTDSQDPNQSKSSIRRGTSSSSETVASNVWKLGNYFPDVDEDEDDDDVDVRSQSSSSITVPSNYHNYYGTPLPSPPQAQLTSKSSSKQVPAREPSVSEQSKTSDIKLSPSKGKALQSKIQLVQDKESDAIIKNSQATIRPAEYTNGKEATSSKSKSSRVPRVKGQVVLFPEKGIKSEFKQCNLLSKEMISANEGILESMVKQREDTRKSFEDRAKLVTSLKNIRAQLVDSINHVLGKENTKQN